MEKKRTYGVIYSFIQIHLIWGLVQGTFEESKTIYVFPGMDVNLTCQIQRRGSLAQIQWSKITNHSEIIAIYHPQYGYHCDVGISCESLISFTKSSLNVLKWTLHLRNVSAALSGKYECSFTLFPDGIWSRVQNLLVQPKVAQDERGGNYTVEVLFNHTLEIPCFQNIFSVASSGITLRWWMEKNGTQETLIFQNNTFLKNRNIQLKDHGLYLSSIEISDDDREFSCNVAIQPDKILKNVTRIKVFAKPEISMNMQNNSIDTLEIKFNCLVRNIFPTANLSWYINGEFLQNKKGICITTEKKKNDNGFYELISKLKILKPYQPIQSNNLTIWCMTLFPVPGNEMWNISSRKIAFSLSYVNIPTDSFNITASTFSTFTSPSSSNSTTGYVNSPTDSSNMTVSNTSIITPSLSSTTRTALGMFTSTYKSILSGADTTLNGTMSKKTTSGVPWPVMVAGLLFICFLLFGLGIRKWCQYWKEIMERPPSFKPPPPPIKYTCIAESVGGDLPCHEMETL
ncbi:T-cell surface protein tactile [Macrotis lagotis]|uniref:T-cell surface protein tactile n=1 Tax=Macrotis lagotis TaxID=92651 RepID=UPI003D68D38F